MPGLANDFVLGVGDTGFELRTWHLLGKHSPASSPWPMTSYSKNHQSFLKGFYGGLQINHNGINPAYLKKKEHSGI
jgi:hypothetical protein